MKRTKSFLSVLSHSQGCVLNHSQGSVLSHSQGSVLSHSQGGVLNHKENVFNIQQLRAAVQFIPDNNSADVRTTVSVDQQRSSHFADFITCTPAGQGLVRRCSWLTRNPSVPLEKFIFSSFGIVCCRIDQQTHKLVYLLICIWKHRVTQLSHVRDRLLEPDTGASFVAATTATDAGINDTCCRIYDTKGVFCKQ
jgi:hypothetical protein